MSGVHSWLCRPFEKVREMMAAGITIRSLVGTALAFLLAVTPPADAQVTRDLVLQQIAKSRTMLDSSESVSKRRAELRRSFLTGAKLWPPLVKTPLNPVLRDSRDHEGYRVENVSLETLPGFYLTGNLYRPMPAVEKSPVLLVPHGHFIPLGRFHPDQQALCAHLAQMGVTVFSYGMVGWNDSQQTTHDDPHVLALQTWNSIRAVDFLMRLPGIDPKRIGVAGASGGGTQSLYLTFLDDRIRAISPVVIVYPWTDPDGCKCEGGLPVLQHAGSNIIEVAALCTPRPQLILTVGGDATKDFPEVGLPFVKSVYTATGSPAAITNIHFPDEQHDQGLSKRKAIYSFFAKLWNLKESPEDLARIAIEQPDVLTVFDAAYPLPDGAAKTPADVAKLFGRALRHKEEELPDSGWSPAAEGEGEFITPAGYVAEGEAKRDAGEASAHLKIIVKDAADGKPTPCRITVVGNDGNYYLPPADDLAPYSFNAQWPAKDVWGNRPGKAPYRPLGKFFYSRGDSSVAVPPGNVRIEVTKGFEYQPVTISFVIEAGAHETREIAIINADPLAKHGYFPGDTHLHFPRATDRDDHTIIDLLSCEGVNYGAILAYNEPAGPYAGMMERMASPQFRQLGEKSVLSRDGVYILSGQEYRTAHFGHLNLYLRDSLVAEGKEYDADQGPVYGELMRPTRTAGGIAMMAHGGYGQEIYADIALGEIDAVELLQFGVYRGIGLADWYRILSSGYRFPAVGASDFPACRWLSDCRTYAYADHEPSIQEWLRAMAAGQSFVTTGPLLLLEVDGHRPGDRIDAPAPVLPVRIRLRSDVAPVSSVQLIINGHVTNTFPVSTMPGEWIDIETSIAPAGSAWVAVRAVGLSPGGMPNAEAHTNPVYIYRNGRAPFEKEAIDVWIERIDAQMAIHRRRTFTDKARVLDYFQRARDTLLSIRQQNGLPADANPFDIKSKSTTAGTDAPFDASKADVTEAELANRLQRLPCKSPSEALRLFETVPGFHVELAAAEPLVVDPIAGTFDENGNLYIAEMRDYPYKPKEGKDPIGTVRILRDVNGDGTFDESHVFAEKLLWPAGIACWKGGVFVAACPDIWYLKDTDGDFKADIKEKVFTGFGTENQQAMVNNLVMGLDNKIYGATAGNGGTIRRVKDPSSPTIPLDGRDFRFDPETLVLEPITGTVQFGNAFDDWGNRFVCDESEPIKQIVLPMEYLSRNPFFVPPATILDLSNSPVPIFRISPVERWREIRSSRRVAQSTRKADSAGASHHVIDASAGVCIYRGAAFPEAFHGQVFVGCGQNNIIHHRTLVQKGVTFESNRVEPKTEFVRTPDNWFRPVNILNAPDGTLYCLDMCREVLESIHIPLDVVKQLDLTSGRDRGRIYRIAPDGFKSPPTPHYSTATSADLVKALENPNGWDRDTAQRLLVERHDLAVAGELQSLALKSNRPESRLHALWTLDALGALSDTTLLHALRDTNEHVREHVIRMTERRINQSKDVLKALVSMADDPAVRVRMQLAFALGEANDPDVAKTLVHLLHTSGQDPWVRAAILSSSSRCAELMLKELLADPESRSNQDRLAVIDPLLLVVGAQGNHAGFDQTLSTLEAPAWRDGRLHLVNKLTEGYRRGGKTIPQESQLSATARHSFEAILDQAKSIARDQKRTPPERSAAIAVLSMEPLDQSRDDVEASLVADQPTEVQIAAVRALDTYDTPAVAEILLAPWTTYSPDVRDEVMRVLLARPARAKATLEAARDHRVSLTAISAGSRESLTHHSEPSVRELAKAVLDQPTATRATVIERYRAALSSKGDVGRGKEVFRRVCANCHQVAGEGFAVGPTLSSNSMASEEAVLTNILDPNRQVAPNYEQFVVLDESGRSYTGMIADQTGASVTLRRERGEQDILLRSNIDQITATGKSLMPEGLEQNIKEAEMNDLITYLKGTLSGIEDRRTRDFGTLPGLIEPAE